MLILPNFYINLERILKFLSKQKMEIIICDDFNVNYLVNDNKKQNLLLQSYSYSDMVKFPTRTSMTSSTTIDNIFTDGTRFKNIDIKPITPY